MSCSSVTVAFVVRLPPATEPVTGRPMKRGASHTALTFTLPSASERFFGSGQAGRVWVTTRFVSSTSPVALA